MDTERLVKIMRNSRRLVWEEGGASTSGDLSAMIPLLHAALRNESPEELQKAILGYEKKSG